ncbi:chitinase-like protein 3 [Ornithodoros turicata]|uniref:chitinase-like protein 3 n=1 Tax=Ornithodoros turicata TaxID=34597 RepID=UPI003139D53B
MRSHRAALDDEQWLLHQSLPRAFPIDRDPFIKSCVTYGGVLCVTFTVVLVGVVVGVLSYELHQSSKATAIAMAALQKDEVAIFCHVNIARLLNDYHYPIERVPGNYCTHVVFPLRGVFGWTNETLNFDVSFSAATSLLEGPREELTKSFPRLKQLIAIGDESHSGRQLFPTGLSNSTIYLNFMIDLVKWVMLNRLDGVVLHKVFPIEPKRRKQVIRFLVNLKAVMERHDLQFVVTVPQYANVLHLDKKGRKLTRFLDYVAVVMHELDEVNTTDPILTPLFKDTKRNSIEDVMASVIEKGLAPAKMLLTINLDGYVCTLDKPYEQSTSVTWNDTKAVRQVPYREICKMLKDHEGWTSGIDADSARPFVFKGHYWIGYENQASIRKMASLVAKLGLGGVFIWDITSDDFEGNCGPPSGLVQEIFMEIYGMTQPGENLTAKVANVTGPNGMSVQGASGELGLVKQVSLSNQIGGGKVI